MRHIGEWDKIIGLLEQGYLNGKQAIVLKCDSDQHRHQVELRGTGEINMIKTANQRLMRERSCQKLTNDQ